MGHYIKVIMDEVFGQSNFRNEISRIKCNPKNFNRKAYGNIKDSIYFYSKGPAPIWNEPLVKKSQDEQDRLFNKTDNQGRRFTTNPLHAPGETASGDSGKPWHGVMPPAGRHWRNSHEVMDQLERDGLIHWSKNGVPRKIIYAENFSNKKLQDIWEFKDKPNPIYPTEKNLEMLKLIVSTSSNPDSIVLDAFAGSGSFGWAAHLLNRKWITIDESQKAIDTINKRFDEKPNSLLNGTAPRNWKLKKLIR